MDMQLLAHVNRVLDSSLLIFIITKLICKRTTYVTICTHTHTCTHTHKLAQNPTAYIMACQS